MQRFDEYMEEVLYGPDGFYSSGRGIAGGARPGGRAGDFITSPSVGPLFGAVIARCLDSWWHESGEPDSFRVIDAGTGPGALLRSLKLAAPDCSAAWELIGVDRAFGSPGGKNTGEGGSAAKSGSENGSEGVQGEGGAANDGFTLTPELPADLTGAVVIANELLDNLPFRIMKRRSGEPGSGWEEVYVESCGGGLVEVEAEASCEELEVDPGPGLDIGSGQRVPVLNTASAWIADVLDRGASRVLAFDYGTATTAELGRRGGWLRTYRQHERGDDPYREPGEWDITTDIAVDQLPMPSAVSTQQEWLLGWGIAELVDEGRDYWRVHASAPDLAAMRMRSRIREAEALLDPDGLGSWLALTWIR